MLKATLLMAMMHVRTDIFLLFYKKKKNYNNNNKKKKKKKNEHILMSLFLFAVSPQVVEADSATDGKTRTHRLCHVFLNVYEII